MFKIEIPSHSENIFGLRFFLFSDEQVAIDSLEKIFTQKNIDFKFKQTKDRKVFVNNEKGELASIVSR